MDTVVTTRSRVRVGLGTASVLALLLLALASWSNTSAADVAQTSANRSARIAAAAQDSDAANGTVTMTLLHNNDGESKLLPNIEGGFPGIARFAESWVDLGSSSEADILLRVSSGDNFLASKEFSASLAQGNDLPLYDSVALRGLYEAMGLGNHDFDFGPEVTAQFIEGFRLNESSSPVPFVAANIDVTNEPALQALVDEGRIAPSVVVTDPTSGLRVGVIGALTPRLPNISSPRNVVVDPDVAGRVNAEVERLEAEGIDRVVLVSHLQGLDEDRDLVPQLRGVDIVVAGGGDELLKNDDDSCQPDEEAVAPYPLVLSDADGIEVPVVTAPGGYRCIGQLDITFDAEGKVMEFTGSSIGVALDGQSEEFARARVEEPLTAALAELEGSVIARTDVTLDGRRNSVRTAATNEGELLADALLAAGQNAPDFGGPAAVVAVQNGGGIRNDALIAPGDITEADTFDIAPFANFVVTGEVSRERFKEMLETGVSGLPSAEGTFPQIAGFTLEVDANLPGQVVDSDGDCSVTESGSRVRNVTLNDGTVIVSDGQVVPGPDLALATIDFLANGGDCYPLDGLDFTKVGASYQQALSAFLIDELEGSVTADAYPEGGSRITIVSDALAVEDPEAAGDAGDLEGAAEESAETDAAADASDDSTDDEAAGGDVDAVADEAATSEELASTGVDAMLFLVVALTAGAAGALVYLEAKRAGWLSLTNRLAATQAWDPDAKIGDAENSTS